MQNLMSDEEESIRDEIKQKFADISQIKKEFANASRDKKFCGLDLKAQDGIKRFKRKALGICGRSRKLSVFELSDLLLKSGIGPTHGQDSVYFTEVLDGMELGYRDDTRYLGFKKLGIGPDFIVYARPLTPSELSSKKYPWLTINPLNLNQ